MSTDGQRTKWHRNTVENFNRLSRVHERYRHPTDDEMTDGQRHSEFTFAEATLVDLRAT